MKGTNPYRVKNMIARKADTPKYSDISDMVKSEKCGSLKVNVYHKELDEPIENAQVRVYLLTISGMYQEKGEGRIITTVVTGADGCAPVLTLPELNRLQQSENKDNTYNLYMMAVFAKGYYSAYAFDIQIFPDIATSYKINLSSVNEGASPYDHYEFIIEPNWK